MDNLVKKLTYAGLGFMALSRKKAQDLAEEISEKTNLSEEEGKKLVEDLSAESNKLKDDLNKTVKAQVEKTLHKLEIPTREELNDLKRRIRHLEEALEQQNAQNKNNG